MPIKHIILPCDVRTVPFDDEHYAKFKKGLQRTFDVHQIIHCPSPLYGVVVALGIITGAIGVWRIF